MAQIVTNESGVGSDPLRALEEALFGIIPIVQRSSYRERLLQGLSHDVGLATLRLLRVVQRADHALSIGEVAELLAIAPSTASRLADQGVTSGYVEKIPDVEDRRQTRLRLTATGHSILKEVNARRQEMLVEATENWDDAELRWLTRLLSNLLEDLRRLIDPPRVR